MKKNSENSPVFLAAKSAHLVKIFRSPILFNQPLPPPTFLLGGITGNPNMHASAKFEPNVHYFGHFTKAHRHSPEILFTKKMAQKTVNFSQFFFSKRWIPGEDISSIKMNRTTVGPYFYDSWGLEDSKYSYFGQFRAKYALFGAKYEVSRSKS